eukprot:TRINITY_DN396_c0_g1_i4.p1 TRINITY_DN396_c0_g1~~TRINITY_DN396_c0_g1_i4.p1  ORF type:complete len:148 (+),score=51.54 TRINITY_DN396_c0_g1_i4:50-493(+)
MFTLSSVSVVHLVPQYSFFFFFLMIRRPPRSTLSSSSAASDVYKRQVSTQSTGDPEPIAMSGPQKYQKVMTQPINLIFRFLQNKQRIQIWLYENTELRLEGRIIGFDEYMNLVLDDAEEVSKKKDTRKELGRILLKGDNITLMMPCA